VSATVASITERGASKPHKVELQLKAIYEKLRVRSRVELGAKLITRTWSASFPI
jgi:DNA-binding NarL/FixJ family response regulator